MKKVLIIAVILVISIMLSVLIVSKVTTMYSGDMWIYRDIEELSSRATDIVRVEVLGSRVRWISTALPPSRRDREDHVVHRLRVIEVFKGGAEPGAVMEVMQPGPITRRLTGLDAYNFARGEDLILFMRSFDDGLPAVLLTLHQAVYRVVTSDDSSIEVENYCEFNDLILTMEDLQRIADEYFGRNP